MKKDELITPIIAGVATPVDMDKLPDSISGMITKISDLEKEVINSEESAKEAMRYVNDMERYEEKGKWIFRHRSGNTKEIIDDTQKAVVKLADAQQVSVSALKKSFEFQKRLAEVSKNLFELGCANIAMNRTVVLAIEAKLNGASKEQISELARQEMMNVVRQLKQQEDIFKKQEILTSKVKDNVSRLDEKDILDKEQSEAIQKNAEEIKRLEGIPQKLEENVSRLNEKDILDKEQSEAIQKNAEEIKRLEGIPQKLEENVSRLNEKDILDKQQSETIQQNAKDIKQIFELIEHDKSKMMCGHIFRDLLNAVGLIAIGVGVMQFQNKVFSCIAICTASVSLLSCAIDFVRNVISKKTKGGRKRGMSM
ncbi:MAG: hypothetical protein J1E32_01425 [Treponema sp.]|nr:hypothetical protein [Treponema sp.]